METATVKKEKWEIFRENYFISEDGCQNESPEIEDDPFDRIEILSPYISHVKIKKAIMKAPYGFMDAFNDVNSGENLTEENYWSELRLIRAIKKCEHKLILGNALVLLEINGLLDCVCYILELGEYKNRGRIKPIQLRKRKLPICPDINLL
jgi:hypothetical protein